MKTKSVHRSADFHVCHIAGFQTRRPHNAARSADLEISDTGGLETGATIWRKRAARFAMLGLVVLAALNCCFAQQPAESLYDTNKFPPPANLTTQQDHRLMMDLLGIKSLRPGANPNNPNATNAVNLDEAKANPYSNLPDPLVLKNGDRVTSAEMWRNKRRPEIVEDFDREIYGRVPTNVPSVK